MVFQSAALFLHMRVIDNLTIGLTDVRKLDRREARDIAMAQLAKVRMSDYAIITRASFRAVSSSGPKSPALCLNPAIMLFDEPTAS
jgi:ABC-type polar amino acid transport system ATPase subunit